MVFERQAGAYLYWSFPITYRSLIYFRRTSPYVFGEHWTYEAAPGVMWLFEPGHRGSVFTLSVSAVLWWQG